MSCYHLAVLNICTFVFKRCYMVLQHKFYNCLQLLSLVRANTRATTDMISAMPAMTLTSLCDFSICIQTFLLYVKIIKNYLILQTLYNVSLDPIPPKIHKFA